MRNAKLAVLLAAGAMVLGGCSPKQTTKAVKPEAVATMDAAAIPTPEALTAPARWTLVELRGQPVVPTPEVRSTPFIVFEREGNRIRGHAGCNNFVGSCEPMPGDRLRFSNVAATKMACPEMKIETEFLQALEATDSYFTDGKVLMLHRARMAPLAVFEAAADAE